MQDNRRFPRVEYRSRIDVVSNDQLINPVPFTSNVSERGLQLSGVELREGQELKLFVMLPALRKQTARLVPLAAQVVWSRDGATGVRFVSPPRASTRPLRAFVREHLAD